LGRVSAGEKADRVGHAGQRLVVGEGLHPEPAIRSVVVDLLDR
jgi:hypothetical protein